MSSATPSGPSQKSARSAADGLELRSVAGGVAPGQADAPRLSPNPSTGDLVLPAGALLLHVGPHKTGTTTLQVMLATARPQLAAHGVVYPGRERHHSRAALALSGGKAEPGEPPAGPEHWKRLLDDVQLAGERRVVVSSEYFCDLDDAQARQVVDALGRERLHVLVTLRPLSAILPSAWQQYVRNKLRSSYPAWLTATLRKPESQQLTPSFWRRHHHDVLVERWARLLGPQNVTVLVLDPADRDLLPRSVEEMLGLPAGTLDRSLGSSNRSLTAGEIELVRQLNLELKRREWPDLFHRSFVRRGFVMHFTNARTPLPDEPRIVTPRWALEAAAGIGAKAAERIAATGARVIGDLRLLGEAPAETAPPDGRSAADQAVEAAVRSGAVVPTDVAVQAVVGTITASVGTDERKRVPVLSAFTSRQLLGVVANRLRARIRVVTGLRERSRRRNQQRVIAGGPVPDSLDD